MEVVCQRTCYDSTSCQYYTAGQLYEVDDRVLEGRGLMKHFKPLNAMPPRQAEAVVQKEEARRETVSRLSTSRSKK